MTDKPAKPKGTENERESEKEPPRSEEAKAAPQKKKPGDAARKMRAMFKGG
ncbi:hypothetical protein SAMN05443665_1012102 [Actinomadura meyerae]|uniref:Uncharacterized protein n=1 Tax=Actinomadura meyerae TaxID=240840 RepID=A0A239IF79_9ACTN|nr:hypothetical protein [Actinomadura meyerae]SNS92189.1 hypothetical protein SAMN05443665_1012102 [Actinomadura meyerae]